MLKIIKQRITGSYYSFGISGDTQEEIISYLNFLWNARIISTPRGCRDAMRYGDDLTVGNFGNPESFQFVSVNKKRFIDARADWHVDEIEESLVRFYRQSGRNLGKAVHKFARAEALKQAYELAELEFNNIPEETFLNVNWGTRRNAARPPLILNDKLENFADEEVSI